MGISALETVQAIGALVIAVASVAGSGLPEMFSGTLWSALSKSLSPGSAEEKEAIARARRASRVALSRARVSGANHILTAGAALVLWLVASSSFVVSWLAQFVGEWVYPTVGVFALLLALAAARAGEWKLLQDDRLTSDRSSIFNDRGTALETDAALPSSNRRPSFIAWAVAALSTSAAVVASIAAWNANTIAEKTWTDSGSAFSVTSGTIQYWGPIESFETNGSASSGPSPTPTETSQWTVLAPERTAAYDKVLSPNAAYAIVTLSNDGRTPGSVQTVGWAVSPTKIIAGQPRCERDGSLRSCDLPMRVEVAEAVKMYVQIDNAALAAMTCNGWVAEQGLVMVVNDSRPDGLRWVSRVRVAQATYCETPRPEIEGPQS